MNIESNEPAVKVAEKIIIALAKEGIRPFRIVPPYEGVLYLGFIFDNILAYLEIDNDGDTGIIAEDMDTSERNL